MGAKSASVKPWQENAKKVPATLDIRGRVAYTINTGKRPKVRNEEPIR
jgi:hypothetical protein